MITLRCLIILCTFGLFCCIDTIEIDLPQQKAGRLVIEGSVDRTAEDYIFQVFVTRTRSSKEEVVNNLEPANIRLNYLGETVFEIFNGEELRYSIDSFHVQYGGDPASALFKIEVDVAGNLFESDFRGIIDNPEPGELSTHVIAREELNDIENIITREYVELRISSTLRNRNGETVSLLWNVDGYYEFPEIIWDEESFFFDPKTCYVYEGGVINEVNMINGSRVNGDGIQDFKIGEKLADYRFHAGYLYRVTQRTLDPDAAQYWEQLELGIEREGTIFEEPPGRSISNITSITDPDIEVLGYFHGSAIDTIYKLARPSETGYQRHLCSYIVNEEPCCSCLTIRGSSLDPPKHWSR